MSSIPDTLPFDRYDRLSALCAMIEAMDPAGVWRVLDVGGYPGALADALPGREVWTLDMPECARPRYSQGSACVMPFGDGEFDLVLASDVLEHIPQPQRKQAIGEMTRVARRRIAISGPFDTPGVRTAESKIAEWIERLTNKPNPWLAEHAERGLPQLLETVDDLRFTIDDLRFIRSEFRGPSSESQIASSEFRVPSSESRSPNPEPRNQQSPIRNPQSATVFPQGDLLSWLLMMFAECAIPALPGAQAAVEALSQAHNQRLAGRPSSGATYRHVILAAKDESASVAPSGWIAIDPAAPRDGGIEETLRAFAQGLDPVISSLARLALPQTDSTLAPEVSSYISALEQALKENAEMKKQGCSIGSWIRRCFNR
ncbi:MAG: class I SAM-dependent methyltransferase [Candidatus Sumerlaeota bacterium]|nr:class I SAM-dependent methyltransferase [Candidatus Sumerlaeota bacterium]